MLGLEHEFEHQFAFMTFGVPWQEELVGVLMGNLEDGDLADVPVGLFF